MVTRAIRYTQKDHQIGSDLQNGSSHVSILAPERFVPSGVSQDCVANLPESVPESVHEVQAEQVGDAAKGVEGDDS